jgi:hypothetical protein
VWSEVIGETPIDYRFGDSVFVLAERPFDKAGVGVLGFADLDVVFGGKEILIISKVGY